MAVVFLLLLIVLVAVALAGFNRPVHHVRYVRRRRPRPTTVVHEEIVERPRPPEVWEEIVEP